MWKITNRGNGLVYAEPRSCLSQWQLLTMLKQEIGIGWQVDGNPELN